jgi:hypothetical protein
MMDGGQISTSTFARGHGGDLRVVATEAIFITGRGSELPQTGLFSVANASGDAGHLVVSAPRILISDGAQISSSSFGPGAGGSVTVTATDTLTLAGTSPIGAFISGIFANAQGRIVGAGAAGNIVVSAPRILISDGAQISSSSFGEGVSR